MGLQNVIYFSFISWNALIKRYLIYHLATQWYNQRQDECWVITLYLPVSKVTSGIPITL